MVPAVFDYRAPDTLEEAVDLLGWRGDEAKVLAGGQSLIPLLKLRFTSPALLVDIGRIAGIDGIAQDGATLRIGARARHSDIEAARGLPPSLRILSDAVRLISDPLVRNMGTAGGSLCHADPAGDWGSVMVAVGAQLVARSRSGERVVAASDFFQGPFTTVLRSEEVLTEIRVPVPTAAAGGTYLKLERKVGDFATVGVAVQVEISDGRIARAGIGLTAVGPQNIRAVEAERVLTGAEPGDEAVQQAARLAAEAAEPHDDVRGSADYKRDVVRVYVQRGLRTAVARAREMQS